MNKVVQTLTNHRSFREYSNEMITEEELSAIITAAQSAPTWIHGQQVSVIVVTDIERKNKLAELCGNQDHIRQAPVFLIFCADFHRAKIASELEGVSFEAIEDIDSVIVGATDVGIALGNAIAAAESYHLGTVCIGGIRKNPLDVIEILQLPKYVIPISGLCIGYGQNDPGKNLRLPIEAFYHKETYHTDQTAMVEQYNKNYEEFTKERSNGQRQTSWTKRVAGFYQNHHYNGNFPNIAKMLNQQGFECKDIK
ncbi:NADPH-dependent oxidoreductase [Halalkalibacter hemicellulosilyticus]|uniref:Oxygen-insensitive NADPH nitroreductase n=1 Tax=Halalkalibacter hemicellulosilyticusJCM 9152 TaxID=1236971 RepID=W4QB86_9BACI|nr:NADPH-dependent oxidoreductase [Halalkalibacter hemicellulosilyticus]GAE28913.1 oxygen-insensitive NADPH nitroreductase [Halalkalibacter hemicellulosilyticusJCM 9152]